ncbi:uncharacterized protein N7511_000683 [Penicillium nucicola]|uniref:uncharacterized protein n=1 Tax=Penicillium nucicola TaxID=1850975 RepID=UPI002544DB13|nr:uncharacterized protein N7511_000683 [Penicillium nucicola]KAJ5775672.1 hypothetical protein N7511_000683 [Penicillium nucicola]
MLLFASGRTILVSRPGHSLRHPGHSSSHTQEPQSSILAQKGPASPIQPSPISAYPPHTLGNGFHYGPQEAPYYTSHSAYTTPSAHYASSEFRTTGPHGIHRPNAETLSSHLSHSPIILPSFSSFSTAGPTWPQYLRPLASDAADVLPTLLAHEPCTAAVRSPSFSPATHPLTTQSMMMPPQKAPAQMPPHQSPHIPTTTMTSSPIMKLDNSQQPTPPQQVMHNPPLSATNSHSMSASNIHSSPPLGGSSSAAPGPIPATTPLVVRQDSNGVQWIAFEYSRDRVKMEYTIRCDVESVNVDTLDQNFKTENCVYPRACCSKDQYRGNRLVYETECNAVGWALAELNPALRSKRGLIQRAVDSWRNSNQDPRLRSRRVRRMAKINRRQSVPTVPASHMPGAGPAGPGLPGPIGAMPAAVPRPNLGPISMGPPQLQHHHHQPDGSPHEEVSGPMTNLRPAHLFHNAPSTLTPSPAAAGPSMPPLLHDTGMASLSRHPTIATATQSHSHSHPHAHNMEEQGPTNDDLFSHLPDGKRRKFILVDDPQRGCRVRVKVALDKVNMDEIPDSYRASNAVYPRTYFPIQMRDENHVVLGKRFFRDEAEHADPAADPLSDATLGRTSVPMPMLEVDAGRDASGSGSAAGGGAGDEVEVEVPRLSRKKHTKELLLNDLGYRMSWSQSRVFAGRMLFLQRSLDAYRNKMRSSMLAAGQDPAEIPDHFDTRRGKRRFLERGLRENAAQRSAEEVVP